MVLKFSKISNKSHRGRKNKNKTKSNKTKNKTKKNYKGGSFGGPGSFGGTTYYPQHSIRQAVMLYINQMIAMGYDPRPLIPDFVQQMHARGYDPRIAEHEYYQALYALGYPIAPMGMGFQTGHVGPPMAPMGSMAMSPPMAPPMGPMASMAMAPPIAPPPPPVLTRQYSDSVVLYRQLSRNVDRKKIMNDLMERNLLQISFGSDIVDLMPGSDGYINEKKSGYYFNWSGRDAHGNQVQKCHLTLHRSPSTDAVGTLHVKDDETFDGNTSQSIKISIYFVPPRHYNIGFTDETNPPNPRLRAFAERIIDVIIEYYTACGETAGRIILS